MKAWEGINTKETHGRNQLTVFAIHILTVVANSAGCERLFSDYGIIHTKRRSRLAVENVRKTGIVRMDLKRTHISEGYIRPRKRKLGEFEDSATIAAPPPAETTSVQADQEPLEDEPLELIDFADLAEQLIRDAADSDELDLPPISVSVPQSEPQPTTTTQSATSSSTTARTSRKTNIPLQHLFRYPQLTTDPWDGLDHYWKGGVTNLESEMKLYEGLSEGNNHGE